MQWSINNGHLAYGADLDASRTGGLASGSMIDEPQARRVAQDAVDAGSVVLGPVRELTDGWFFPCVTKGADFLDGVVVNKTTSRALPVRTYSPLSRDVTLYDRGYHYHAYDLVVLAVDNVDEAVRVLHTLHEVTTDTYYRNDRVYRVGRALTEDEVRSRLTHLPCVFSGHFEMRIDELEQAREAGWFTFKLFEYRGKT